ncbi:MAG: hypothetical protein QMC65_04495, partial [Candidatus Poseidoniaceae archaeon]
EVEGAAMVTALEVLLCAWFKRQTHAAVCADIGDALRLLISNQDHRFAINCPNMLQWQDGMRL